jgi:type IV pilus assembly protein PilE
VLSRRLRCRAQAGYSMLEAVLGMALLALLASIALPSLSSYIDRSRRADAIAALFQAQLAQERWRANQPAYGNLAQIGVAPQSSAGHYRIEVTAAGTDGYEILATATGVQARDVACRYLKLAMSGANLVQASASADPAASNPDAVNRRCWSL